MRREEKRVFFGFCCLRQQFPAPFLECWNFPVRALFLLVNWIGGGGGGALLHNNTLIPWKNSKGGTKRHRSSPSLASVHAPKNWANRKKQKHNASMTKDPKQETGVCFDQVMLDVSTSLPKVPMLDWELLFLSRNNFPKLILPSAWMGRIDRESGKEAPL